MAGAYGYEPDDGTEPELCEAMLDDDDPDVWDLGFEALDMIPGVSDRWHEASTPSSYV